MKSKTTSNIVNCLRNYLSQVGTMKYLISDNYKGFKSKEFVQFLRSHGIVRPESAPYKSRARAHVENANGLLEQGIKHILLNDRDHWEDVLPIVTYLLNHRKFLGSSLSAAQLHFGTSSLRHDVFRPEQAALFQSVIPKNFWEFKDKYNNILDQAEQNLMEKRKQMAEIRQERANQSKSPSKIKEGDIIVLKNRTSTIGVSSKLVPAFERTPYKVVKAGTYNVVAESLLDGSQIMRSNIDAKLIRFADGPSLENLGCPKEVLEMLGILTADNIIEIFEGKLEYTKPPQKMETRQTSKANQEVQDMLDDLLAELDGEDDRIEKTVTFDL